MEYLWLAMESSCLHTAIGSIRGNCAAPVAASCGFHTGPRGYLGHLRISLTRIKMPVLRQLEAP